MSESENVERVRAAFARWNLGDHEALIEEFDPEVEIRAASSEGLSGEPFVGYDGFRAWIATMEESFEVWEIHPQLFHERGDVVVVLGSMHLRGRGSGVELDQETGWVLELRDGRVRRLRAFLGHEQALAAGGIS